MMAEPSTTETPIQHHWTASHVAGFILLIVFCSILVWNAYHPEDVFFHDVKYEVPSNGNYLPREDVSTGGTTLQIDQTFYPRGIAVSAPTLLETRFIPENYSYFTAEIGLDENSPLETPAPVIFTVLGDGAILYESPPISAEQKPIRVHVPIKHIDTLQLEVRVADEQNQGADAIWAMPRFIYSL